MGQVYLNDETCQPEWVISTGLFGKRQSFAPLYGSSMSGEELRLAVAKDLIKDAPNLDDDSQLSGDEQRSLYDHYTQYLGGGGSAGPVTYRGDNRAAGDDDAMTRSEERLRVGTENVPVGRTRLRKFA